MTKKYLKRKWRKLDNTAKIFSLDEDDNTNIFRYSVILKQNVKKEILLAALKKSLETYTAFRVKIGTGLFWNYLDYNTKEPIVWEEEGIPCQHIDYKKNNDYLFKISYYKKKINLDIFHVLTDGTGAIHFLKAIIYNYLDLKNNLGIDKVDDNEISYQDQYLKNYDKKLKDQIKLKGAYLFPEKVKKNTNNTYHYTIDIKKIKKVCNNYKATITEYLTALYIYAIYRSIYNKKSKKEIVITVPIDLRKYYKVDTLANFFVCMNINPKIVEKKLTTFAEILNEVKLEFKEKLTEDKIKKYLARDVKLGMNISVRLIPLFIKKLFIKYVGIMVSKAVTSTVSNVGIIDIDDRYKKYIDNVLVLVMPGKFQKIKCTVCSFKSKLNVTLNSNIDDLRFEQVFFKLLQEQINGIKFTSNVCTNLLK